MTILFAGSEMDAFSPSDGAQSEGSSLPGQRYDSAFSRGYIGIGGVKGTSYVESAAWTGQSELYYHYAGCCADFLQTYQTFALCDGTDPVFRIVAAASGLGVGTLQMQYLDALDAWTDIGGTAIFSSSLTHFDIYLKIDASGVATLISSGTEVATGTADLSHLSTVDRARHYRHYSTNYISQCIASTESTVGMRLMTAPPTGAGATSSWTGDYSGVDELAYSDADFLNSGTANQVETMAHTPVGSLTGYTAAALIVSARAKRDASGPQNLQLALRSSGTDYFSSSIGLGVGYAPAQGVWATDPATSAAWVNAAVLTAQPGVKSIT